MSRSLIVGKFKNFLNIWICLNVCSANSLEGSIMSANGALFSFLMLPLEPPVVLGEVTRNSFWACEIPIKPFYINYKKYFFFHLIT